MGGVRIPDRARLTSPIPLFVALVSHRPLEDWRYCTVVPSIGHSKYSCKYVSFYSITWYKYLYCRTGVRQSTQNFFRNDDHDVKRELTTNCKVVAG